LLDLFSSETRLPITEIADNSKVAVKEALKKVGAI